MTEKTSDDVATRPVFEGAAEELPASDLWDQPDAKTGGTAPLTPPVRILVLLVASIFVAEMLVMFFLHLWPSLPMIPEAMLDAALLIMILSPTFYLYHYQPMKQNFLHREAAMNRLKASEERLNLALQAVNDGLWDWDVQGGSVYYSPHCALMLGYQPDELDPNFNSLLAMVHPDDLGRLKQQVDEHFAGTLDLLEIELRLKCRLNTHEWLWVLVRGKVVKRAPDGTPLRAVGTNKNIQARKQAEEALQQSEEGVRYLSRQLIQTAEVEKKRLAQELHDDFGQMITAFKMGVELIQDQKCDQHPQLDFHCSRLLAMGQQMENSLREICDDLRPAILDDLGLTRTLEWLVEQFSERHQEIHARMIQPELDLRLAPEIELVCYRVCQEALHNITKHANATTVDVALSINDKDVQLTISDNGRGFDPRQHQPKEHWGIGLLGIQERAAAIGGFAAIESAPGAGSRVLLTLPRNMTE